MVNGEWNVIAGRACQRRPRILTNDERHNADIRAGVGRVLRFAERLCGGAGQNANDEAGVGIRRIGNDDAGDALRQPVADRDHLEEERLPVRGDRLSD